MWLFREFQASYIMTRIKPIPYRSGMIRERSHKLDQVDLLPDRLQLNLRNDLEPWSAVRFCSRGSMTDFR